MSFGTQSYGEFPYGASDPPAQTIVGTEYASATQYGAGILAQTISANFYEPATQYGAGVLIYPTFIVATPAVFPANFGVGAVITAVTIAIPQGTFYVVGQPFVVILEEQ